MSTTNVQTAIGMGADGTTDLEDAPVAAQLERHEAMPLFVPAPAPLRGQTALETDR